MISPQTELKPVGFYCDHSDEPHDARTHHDWEFVEEQGLVFQPRPETVSSFSYADRPYLKPEDRETRCARAVPLYTEPTVTAALLRTTDGEEVDDDFAIPAGEIRRILAGLRAGGAR